MELLTAVNRILPVLGEHPVTSLNVKHPTLAILLPKIDAKIEDATGMGWWFNTAVVTLYPDSEGGIALPTTTLSFVPTKENGAVARGLRLYDSVNRVYTWPEAVEGTLIERLPFNELPEAVAQYVTYSTMVAAYVTDIGMENDVEMWRQEANDALRRVTSEHLRNMRYSTRKGPRFAKINRARSY